MTQVDKTIIYVNLICSKRHFLTYLLINIVVCML